MNENPGKMCKIQPSLKSLRMPPKYEGWNRVPKNNIDERKPWEICKTQSSFKSLRMPPKYEGWNRVPKK